ncbi:MAG TPA: thiamine-phosphate kinase [Candidatus Angelobacter sp.]|jgi:thiamine-monophosphate kinase|nr:thiamine-phosphate kinase [Candidatus Angelobacter sp.]
MNSERNSIRKIRQLAASSTNQAVKKGIGDDCAILRVKPGYELLVTTDLCIDDVHFRRAWHPAAVVGHRCLTRGLSDIAAMGGEPLACFLSLGLPADLPPVWLNGFLRGLLALAHRYKVQLAGGDISSAPQITADIIVTGQLPAGTAILRSGASPGDRIYVTGTLGVSSATLKQLYAGKTIKPTKSNSHFYPTPRPEVGDFLRKSRLATAMIDMSDGLSVDLSHICEESGVAAILISDKIPIGKNANLELALHGGEDYELLFTAPERAKVPSRIAGIAIAQIGEIGNRQDYSSAIQIMDDNGKVRPLPQRGWEHFSRQRRP